MLEQAKQNAGALADKITWLQMDAQNLAFSDDLLMKQDIEYIAAKQIV